LLGLALALALAAGAPGPDIASAARRLAPPGARVVLAQERSWDRGVVAWDDGRRVVAAPLVWRAHAWRRAGGSGVTVAVTRPRVTGRRAYAEVHVTMRQPLVDDAVWLDGRPADASFFPGPTRGETAVFAANLRPGRHVLVAYAATQGAAIARAVTFTVR
jgi:hypothetical protein